MKATYVWHIDAVNWVVQCGWSGDDREIAVEFTIDDWARQGDDVVKATEKSVQLAKTLVLMRREGASVDDMDKLLRLIALDGGL